MIPHTEYELLAESMPQLVWTKNPDGTREYLNKRWEEYTGRSLDDKAWDWTSVIHEQDYESTVGKWDDSLATGRFFESECRIKDRNGIYKWHLSRAIPVRNSHGQVIVWVGTCTDIHHNKLREEELKKSNKQLQKINADLDNFVYTASHDLKSPITNMEGLIIAMREDLCKKNGNEELLLIDMLNESIRKLKNTIYDLTEISKTQNNLNDDLKEISFQEIFDEVKSDLRKMIEESAVTIHTYFLHPKIAFSHKDLRSIIYNLLTNAIKFRSPEKELKIDVSSYKADGWVVLEIQDNGIGIDHAHKDKVFSMFKRFNAHIEGTGIGLYIVKRIIENNEGKIEVESEKEKGSIFRLYFKG